MMQYGRVFGVAAATMMAVVISLLLPDGANAQARAVLELFTSQGCSSCPAADRLLGELKQEPGLIALSLPVTYWDYLGWKDTLGDPFHTARQNAYAHGRGERNVGTPQVVVNGTTPVLGSDRAAIADAVVRGPGEGSALPVPVALSVADGQITITTAGVPAVATRSLRPSEPSRTSAAEIWLLAVASSIEVAIGRGENTGRTLTYSNVVRGWRRLGALAGAARTFTVPIDDIRTEGVDAVAVLVQGGTSERPGMILGAAIEPLN